MDELPQPFPTVGHVRARIAEMVSRANGRRRRRTVEPEDVEAMLTGHEHLIKNAMPRITHSVARSYGYLSSGTIVSMARHSDGRTVLHIRQDSTNRSGALPGVNPYIKRTDRVQAEVDEAYHPDSIHGSNTVILHPEHVASLIEGHTDEHALLRAVASRPNDETPKLVLADYYDDHGRSHTAASIRNHVAATRETA